MPTDWAAAVDAWCTENTRPPRAEPLYYVAPWVYAWDSDSNMPSRRTGWGTWRAAIEACQELKAHSDVPEPWRSHNTRNLGLCQRALREQSSHCAFGSPSGAGHALPIMRHRANSGVPRLPDIDLVVRS